jgi:hypothetical protein
MLNLLSFLKARSGQIVSVLAALVWRGFGIFLFILGGSMGVGAAVTGSWLTGIFVSFGTLMIGVLGSIGYAIATSGQVTPGDVSKAANDAIKKAQDKAEAETK